MSEHNVTKRIPLTKGKFAIVDAEDYEELSKWKWHAHKRHGGDYVAARSIEKPKRNIYMHRQILDCPKGMEVDHRNHNTLDIRKTNLRICTHSQNLQNSLSHKDSSSEYKGVSWFKRDKKWRAYIQVDDKQIHLGYFDFEVEAARTYDRAAIKYFSEFAYLNFPRSDYG